SPTPPLRPGGFGGGFQRSAPSTSGPSSIATPPPLGRPQPGLRTAPSEHGPSSITTPMPSARPQLQDRFGTRARNDRLPPVVVTPGPFGGDYRRYPGGVYVPYGGSPWGYYPYHYFWWLGMPRPYSYYGDHSSFFGGLFVALLLIVLLVMVAIGI